MKKKSLYLFVCFLLVFTGVFALFGVGLKANAFTSYSQRQLFSNGTTYFVVNPGVNFSEQIFYGNNLPTLEVSEINNNYYFNNNTSYPYNSEQFYLLMYEPVINRLSVYSMELPPINNFTINGITTTLLFYVSGNTLTSSDYPLICSYYSEFITSTGDLGYTGASEYAAKTYFYNDFINTYYYNYALTQRNNGYNSGYNSGYNTGYDDGQAGENAISPVWNLFQGIFGTIGTIFTIELAPHVYIGYFFLVPLFLAVVGLILWIWRRN